MTTILGIESTAHTIGIGIVKNEKILANVRDMLELPILGVIPEDKNIQAALVMKDAMYHTHPRSKGSKAYKQIAAKILGIAYKDDTSIMDILLGR